MFPGTPRLTPLLLAVLLFPVSGRSAEPDAIVGTWLVEDKSGKIQIYRCGQKYCGKTVWIKPTADHPDPKNKLDVHNPDPQKRGQKLWGKTVLWGLSYDSDDDRWEDGSIYDSRRGKVYRCQVSMKESGKLHLRGFVGISLIGATTTWTRVQ